MADHSDEELEAVKKWWDENGTSLMTGIIVAIGGVIGYQAWENSVRETGETASQTYEDLVAASNNIVPGSEDDAMMSTAQSLADTIKTEYGSTTYALFAGLHMAKIAVEAGEMDNAVTELNWVLAQGPDPELETIVKMRLARVLLAKGDATAALAMLEGTTPNSAQLSSWEEVRGDVYLGMGEMRLAREAYQLALESVDGEAAKPLLEVKLADIPIGSQRPNSPLESRQAAEEEGEVAEAENDA